MDWRDEFSGINAKRCCRAAIGGQVVNMILSFLFSQFFFVKFKNQKIDKLHTSSFFNDAFAYFWEKSSKLKR
jgi:hypothetical protein